MPIHLPCRAAVALKSLSHVFRRRLWPIAKKCYPFFDICGAQLALRMKSQNVLRVVYCHLHLLVYRRMLPSSKASSNESEGAELFVENLGHAHRTKTWGRHGSHNDGMNDMSRFYTVSLAWCLIIVHFIRLIAVDYYSLNAAFAWLDCCNAVYKCNIISRCACRVLCW